MPSCTNQCTASVSNLQILASLTEYTCNDFDRCCSFRLYDSYVDFIDIAHSMHRWVEYVKAR